MEVSYPELLYPGLGRITPRKSWTWRILYSDKLHHARSAVLAVDDERLIAYHPLAFGTAHPTAHFGTGGNCVFRQN